MIKENLLEINQILGDYAKEVQEGISDKAIEVADECINKLKNTKGTYKIRTGKYNKSWDKKVTKGSNFVNVKVHNKKHYRLTHLLENGHITRNGKRTKSFPHIAPVEDYGTKKYEKEVEDLIRNGSK